MDLKKLQGTKRCTSPSLIKSDGCTLNSVKMEEVEKKEEEKEAQAEGVSVEASPHFLFLLCYWHMTGQRAR